MGERNSPESGETALAAATAAIITARWQQTPAAPNGGNGHGPSNGHGSNGRPTGGFAEWAPPAAPPPDPGGGFTSWAPPGSPAADPTAAHSVTPFSPVSPAGGYPAHPVSPGPGNGYPSEPPGSAFRPPEPAGSAFRPPEPAGSAFRPPEPAGSTFFSPVPPDPVPEVFDSFPPRDLAPPAGEVRTQVPPGFERRTFGPFPDEPAAPTSPAAPISSAAPTSPAVPASPVAPTSPAEPAGSPPPSALLGVLPPPSWAQPSPPPTLAPPEPAPWVDTGFVGFDDLATSGRGGERSASRDADALVGAGVGGAGGDPLPRRVPRPPDVDFPLFDSDPAEPAPDPATEHHELNRIADYLRDEAETSAPAMRPDGVDLESVLSAVRQVPEVRDAQMRWNAQAGHTLRIEFIDGVDESEVTRSVVRLLRSKLGLAAPPAVEAPTMDSPYRPPVVAPRVPSRATPTAGRRPLPRPSGVDAPRLVVDNVSVTRLGAEATVAVRLRGPRGAVAVGEGRGPGVDAYLSRLAATAAAHAVGQALAGRGQVFIEHVSVVPFGVVEVAVVVLLLSYDGVAEQLSGSAIVGDDPHQAVVQATLGALNRRLESLL